MRIFAIAALLFILPSPFCLAQEKLNSTDAKGMKQGHWIKRYPSGAILYEGFFRDDHPAGEFKRFYENGTIKSLLIYSEDGRDADATLYYPDGKPASKGKYHDQKKEGKWQFFAPGEGYLLSEENYAGDQRHGLSLKFYPDSAVAEIVTWVKGSRNGEWMQYYRDGTSRVKSSYLNGKLNGKFEVWYDNGRKEFSGQYVNDSRDGLWTIFNRDGSVKYKIEYRNGVTADKQIDIDAAEYLDSLERNKDKVADPEKTGEIR